MRKWQRDRIKRGEDPSAEWVRETEITLHGRHVSPGTELSIRGERGARFRFVERVTTPEGKTWLSVIGGPKKCNQWRAFREDRVRRVHRKRTTMTTAEARDLARTKRQARREDAARKERLMRRVSR